MPSRSPSENPHSTESRLRVYVLGPPAAELNAQPVAIPRRQVRALLYVLAAELRPIPREHLCYLFWPDTSESTARRDLSHLLAHLRRALPDPDSVIAQDDALALDPNRVTSDLAGFTQLAAQVDDTAALQQAADLYRGPFLAGFCFPESGEYEAWLTQQQRILERRYLDVLSHLIDAYTASEAYAAAIEAAHRSLAVDDLAEDVHRRLIGLYAVAGNRAAALRQFELLTAVLERELGVRPLPETRAVYESVLQSRPLPTTHPTPDVVWTTLPSLEAPFVGRDAAMRTLEEALNDARDGHGHVVLISGEAGIGKSRLLQAFTTQSRDRAVVLAAAARSANSPLPYQPIAEALRTLPDWEPLAAVPQVWLAEATRLLPELHELHRDLPAPLPAEPIEARTRLFEALCRLLLRLAEGAQPLLLSLDDLQWADSATLDWLVHLASRIADQRILIVCAYRIEEQDRIERLRRALARLARRRELHLAGLDVESVDTIVRHVVSPARPSRALSQRLHRATDGNPFFLLETLRVLVETGPTSGAFAADQIPLPDTVRDAVNARLQSLDPHVQQILEAGAILDGPFSLEIVRRVAGRDEIEAADALDGAVACRILEIEGTTYRFHHTLIRQVVEARLSPVRCQILHRRAARTLAFLEPQASRRIGRHFSLGGEGAKALPYYAKAADAAQGLFAWEEAEGLQGRILDLLAQLDPDGAQLDYLMLRGKTLTERAFLRFLQGRLQDRDADLDALSRLAESSGDEALQLLAATHRVRYHNLGGDYTEAIAEAEAHLPLAQRIGDRGAESRLLAYAGFARYFLGQPEAALIALESAIAAGGQQMDVVTRGRISHILGYVAYHLGNYPRALHYHREAYDQSLEIHDQDRMAWNLMDIGFIHLNLGAFSEAKRCLEESLAIAHRIAAKPAEAYALTLLADWELYQGNYATALDGYRESLILQEAVGSQHGILAAENGVAFATYHLGDLATAREAFERALSRGRVISHQRHISLSLIGLGLVALDRGARADSLDDRQDLGHKALGNQHADAGQLLTEALAVAQDSRSAENRAAALAALARLHRQMGDPLLALNRATSAARLARDHGFMTCLAWAEAETGLALLAMDEPQPALSHTACAIEGVARSHEAWIATEEIHCAHARVLYALGRADEAHRQTDLTHAIVQAKAERILDPGMRQRYLNTAHARLF